MSIKFGLSEPFDVENGSLEGLSREECFVLGVEWQLFRQSLEIGKPFRKMVHKANVERLSTMAQRRGWAVEQQPVSEDWVELRVGTGDR